YLGERFGDQAQPKLEARVAKFLHRVASDENSYQLQSYGNAMGASPDEVLDALRDFYLALFIRERAHPASLLDRLRILDETTSSGQAPSSGPVLPGQSGGPFDLTSEDVPWKSPIHADLPPTSVVVDTTGGLVAELVPASGVKVIRVTIANTSGVVTGSNDLVRVGFVGLTTGG